MKILTNALSAGYEVRTEQLHGIDHWVVPVIMMVEGVHNGSHGPLLYPTEELTKSVGAWEGEPVVINHPSDGRSAASSDRVDQIVGRVFNAQMDDDKLRAEVWVDPSKLKELSEAAYDRIKNNDVLEVSVGVFTEDEDEQGTFNNEDYRAIARNLRPDHLAILPDTTGACSYDDGCGIRSNQKKGVTDVKNSKNNSLGFYHSKEGFNPHLISVDESVKEALTTNEIGFQEIISNLWQKLDQLDNDVRIHFLEEVFDDHLIYRTHNRESGDTKFFRREYTVNEDGSVDFTEAEPVEVRKDVSFQTLEVKQNKKRKMKRNTKPCGQVVDELISNSATQFTEDDRAWLESQDADRLEKLSPVENSEDDDEHDPPAAIPSASTQPPVDDPDEEEEDDGNGSDGDDSSKESKLNSQVEGLVKKVLNVEDLPALKSQLQAQMKLHKRYRGNLISGIVENSEFKEEELKTFGDEQLEKLYKSLVSNSDSTDFSLAGLESNLVDNEDADIDLDEELGVMLGPIMNAHNSNGKKETSKTE